MTVFKLQGLNLTGQVNAATQAVEDAEAQATAAQTARTGAETARTGAEAARDEAEALVLSDLGTTDGQTRALIENPNSQTASALSASTGAQVAAEVPPAVDDYISTTPEVAANAAALALSDAGLLRKGDPGLPLQVETDQPTVLAAERTDTGRVIGKIMTDLRRVFPHVEVQKATVGGHTTKAIENGGDVAWAPMLGPNRELPAIYLDSRGQLPQAVLDRLAAALGQVDETGLRTLLLIVGGQSNANRLTSSQPVNLWGDFENVLYWNHNTSQLTPYPNTDPEWLGNVFAREYVRRNPGWRVVVVSTAVGGTGFSTQANPSGHWDRAQTGTGPNLATQSVTRTQDAIAAATAAGYSIDDAVMLWSQGESDRRPDSDPSEGLSESEYAAAQDDYFSWFRSQIDPPTIDGGDMPILLGSMTPIVVENDLGDGRWAGTASIHRAVLDTPRRVYRTAFVYGPSGYNNPAQTIHYSAEGNAVRAAEMATDALYRARLNVVGSSTNAPRDLAVSRSGDTVTIRWAAPPQHVDSYTIEVSTNGGSTWTPVPLTWQGVSTPIITSAQTTVAAATAISVRAKATNDTGDSYYTPEVKA